MPITQKHAIVCDDFRQENSGKFIIIGMYTPDMQVAQLPVMLPTLTLFAWLESDRPGNFPFRFRLEHLETGKALAEGMGMMAFNKPGPGVTAIRIGGIQIASPGAYTFILQFDGQSERLLTQFSVIFNVNPPIQTRQGA